MFSISRTPKNIRWLIIIAELVFFFTLIGLLLSSYPFTRPAQAAVKCVNPINPACYTTIQAAVNAAFAGETINVSNSTYHEAVVINKNLTIVGESRRNTVIDGDVTKTPLTVHNPAKVSVSSLTIKDGSADSGGGVYNSGTLTLTSVTVNGNLANSTGGGLDNVGFLYLSSVYISSNHVGNDGGGLRNSGTAKLNQVTILENTATNSAGGGISNFGLLYIDQSSVISNTAAGAGGIYNNIGDVILNEVAINDNQATSNNGGGLINTDAEITMTNVTFSGNSAILYGGALENSSSQGFARLVNVTISGNSAADGGGIYHSNSPHTTLLNTILSNNPGGNCYNTDSYSLVSAGHNLEDANACGLHTTGDITNTNPKLGPMLLNLPGTTETIELLRGSPAIDHGTNTGCPSTDQRRVKRPLDGNYDGNRVCDIGAYERMEEILLPLVLR